MTVRLRIALVILAAGVLIALGVVATMVVAVQRFEHERSYDRANAFLSRVVARHDDMLEVHARNPQEFGNWLESLLLFEPDTQLYLLDADCRVLAGTGKARLAPGLKVADGPVKQAVQAAEGRMRMPYVMGDDPEHMNADAVVTARALVRASIRPGREVAGYLYLVTQPPPPAAGRIELFRSSLAGPALAAMLAVVALATLLAAWTVASVTRPLRLLSDSVARAARDGFNTPAGLPPAGTVAGVAALRRDDEFGQLQSGFQALMATLHSQWDKLRRLDRFRREGVSNLSHDLRSPLTATTACLETLERRWDGDGARGADRELLEVALRNTRNAAQLVRSLGDLALLDEPEFKLAPVRMDLGELLDDIVLRFADRAARQQVALVCEAPTAAPPVASVDVELFERALANLLDNALRFTPPLGRIELCARRVGGRVEVSVADSGTGIADADPAQLFDRLVRGSAAGQGGAGGKGLGLAIVKRIAELHQGAVTLASVPGRGTTVCISLPADPAQA